MVSSRQGDHDSSNKFSRSLTSIDSVVSQDKVFSGYPDTYGENSWALPGLKYLTCYAPVSGTYRKNKLEVMRHKRWIICTSQENLWPVIKSSLFDVWCGEEGIWATWLWMVHSQTIPEADQSLYQARKESSGCNWYKVVCDSQTQGGDVSELCCPLTRS